MVEQQEFIEAAMLLGHIIKVAPTNTLIACTIIIFSRNILNSYECEIFMVNK